MTTALIGAPTRMNLKQFAEREKVSLSTARHWVDIGYAPPSYRLGKHRVMDLEQVIKWENDLRLKAQAAR